MAKAALPSWDLSDLYKGISDPSISRDIKRARQLAAAFEKSHKGMVQKLDAKALGEAIAAYDSLSDLLGRIGSYAQLVYAANMMDAEIAQFYQNSSEALTDISAHTLFFALELNKISDKKLEAMSGLSKELDRYWPWIREVRAYRAFQLSDELEQILHDKHVTGRSAWSRLFDETIAKLDFVIDGKKLSSAEAMHCLSSPKPEMRKAAAKVIGRVFGQHAHVFALITNTLAKDKDIEDRWRGFAKPISSRNVSNQVEDKVVEALISTVEKNYPNLAHRYYALKARWFGQKKLDYWDRNAPLPGKDESSYQWEEARAIVLESYAAFSPELAKIGRQFFDKNWIDVPVRTGKSPGAFAHPTVPSAHPYLLVNFQGKTRDVMTLAHELGHGVHQVLSAQQGALMSDTPLTLAETASVFGEQLVFQEILRREKKASRRKVLIASKVEDMLNTVVRQIAFCEFERRVHDERKQGELTVARLGEIWLAIQKESLGPSIRFAPEYAHYWTYIPHFIHSPFYVYAYAFGDCLVNSLYAIYQKEVQAGHAKQFEKKYLEMLRTGGTLRHKELLAPFGIDISKPAFWQEGLNIISGYIDQLEAMA
ncbi:MAG: M3 family oligoendopeptidase [Rickettsiales bacterium]|nr:M3 family oligoendopeptidase [Rickettsiales bacterium]